MVEVVFTCPDYREEKKRAELAADKEGNPTGAIALSSAGANVNARLDSIAQIKRAFGHVEMLAMPHYGPGGQCGGMTVVEDELKRGIKLSDETSDGLSAQFKDRKYADRESLEKELNPKVQKDTMDSLTGVTGQIQLVETLPDPHPGERVLLVGRPTVGSDRALFGGLGIVEHEQHVYPVRALFSEEIAVDLPIFLVKMQIKHVIILPETNVEKLANVGPTPAEFEKAVRSKISEIVAANKLADVKVVSPSAKGTPQKRSLAAV